MQQLILTLILFFSFVVQVSAKTQPAIIFTQDVVAMNADGSRLPSVTIDPRTVSGMQSYDYDLGRDRLLRIQTNISDGEERGLGDLVALVKRCYSYIEAATNLPIKRGVLLYLIEFDEIPTAYSFRASYDDASQWAEVRLALIKRDETLNGKDSMSSLSDLLYDTLPHELGHDVLDSIPQLLHDIDGKPTYQTRWFIEGVCEVLAKGFSKREAPALYRRFLSLRKVDSVLAESRMQANMLNWAQRNDNGFVVESELYGASMLTLMAWIKTKPLDELLDELSSRPSQVRGVDLLAMMQETTGVSLNEMIKRGHLHGQQLNDSVVLATLLD
jgi:hypothetical protein